MLPRVQGGTLAFALTPDVIVRRPCRARSSSPREMAHIIHPQHAASTASAQGLTFVHFSAQCKRFLWHRGAFRECVEGVLGVF